MKSLLLEANLQIALAGQLPVLSAHGNLKALLGYSARDLLAARIHLQDRIHPEDAALAATLFSPEGAPRSGSDCIRIRHADGRMRCLKLHYKQHASRGANAVVDLRLLGAKKNKCVPHLVASFQSLLENSEDVIVFQDCNHAFAPANHTLLPVNGVAKNWRDLLGQTVYDLFSEEFADISYRLEQRILAGNSSACAVLAVPAAEPGDNLWIEICKYPLQQTTGKVAGIVTISRNVTRRIRAEEELKLDEERWRAVFVNAPLGICVCRMDGRFLRVNSAFCQLLQYSEQELLATEWRLVLHPNDRSIAERIAEKLWLETGKCVESEDRWTRRDGSPVWLRLKVSMLRSSEGFPSGFVVHAEEVGARKPSSDAPRHSTQNLAEQLTAEIRAQAEAADRNHALHHTGEVDEAHCPEECERIERIRQAFQEHEFVLHYQPKVNMSTGKVVGAEALIRWRHPQRGLLHPSAFLPVIEDDPLAVELGEWVIASALAQMETWLDEKLDLEVSVNVGAHQLQNDGFVDRLAALLAAHPRVNPAHIELEILESNALRDEEFLSQLLAGCRQLGVSFALDDFGAGHSPLNFLKRLPTHVVKIDPCFVRNILNSPEDLTILEGVLGLATAFNRKSVAEGVENIDQGLTLLRLGCEVAQGYAIARPMPAADLPAWAAAWRPDPRWANALSEGLNEKIALFAGVEHKTWIVAIEAFLKGATQLQPRLGRHECRFGAWLDGETRAGNLTQPAFQAIEALHWRIHAMAAGILKLQAQGRNQDGLARIGELSELLDKLLDQLKALEQTA